MMLWTDFLVIRDWRRRGLADPVAKMLAGKAYLVAGAAVAGACYLVAYFTPGAIFNREVGTGMAAVLRNNFWLALHVLTITASYGAGALAWGLGNLSLGYYAFGRYRTMKIGAGDRIMRRPPAACATLSGYIYKSIQVAVLLLAVGTITGAIWADYAWGRYWNWDPKEVWALITLLVYLAVLHGRWAGWAGSFGMAVGAVAGATSILIAWYGVNFVLSAGLHSYGFGAGGAMAGPFVCRDQLALGRGGRGPIFVRVERAPGDGFALIRLRTCAVLDLVARRSRTPIGNRVARSGRETIVGCSF